MNGSSNRKAHLHRAVLASMVIAIVGIVAIGCQPQDDNGGDVVGTAETTTTDPESLSGLDILAMDRPFKIELYIGNPLQGYDIVVIDSTGKSRIVTRDQAQGSALSLSPYTSIEFDLPREKIDSVRRKIAAVDFQSLKPLYCDPKIADGTTILVRVTAAGRQKVVRCSNKFPKAVLSLRNYVQAEVAESIRQAAGASRQIVPINETMPPF